MRPAALCLEQVCYYVEESKCFLFNCTVLHYSQTINAKHLTASSQLYIKNDFSQKTTILMCARCVAALLRMASRVVPDRRHQAWNCSAGVCTLIENNMLIYI